MGVWNAGIKISKCDFDMEEFNRPKNPDPQNFLILRSEIFSYPIIKRNFIVAEIFYPGCTNYEGRKILIFETALDINGLMSQKIIDPHFCDDKHLSPIARFEPTKLGWDRAILFCEMLIKNVKAPDKWKK